MRNQSRQAALTKGGHAGSNSNNHITNLPYEVLIIILSLMPVKDAVVASTVTKKWRFLWCCSRNLNFDASESLYKINKKPFLYDSERDNYMEQVNSVIRSCNHPVVHRFRINFDLNLLNQEVINEWLRFAINKNVEILELDIENSDKVRTLPGNYVFPLKLSDGSKENRCIWPYSNARVVELASLKKLYLNNVTVRNAILEELLKRSPYLESISIHGSCYLTHIRAGGRCLNLKHFEIKYGFDVRTIFLSDFDLVSFTYKGPSIDLRLTNLPKLKEVNICQGRVGLEKNVFSQISSCVSSLQTVSFTIYHPKKIAKLDSIPQLPNVKKLTLTISDKEDDCLLEFASIAEACPNLETFIIELLGFPLIIRRKASHVASDHPFKNLKVFKILGYCGRICELELAAYVIDNAVELKKIVIDPHYQDPRIIFSAEKDLLKEEAARASAEHQLKRIVGMKPLGAELVIL